MNHRSFAGALIFIGGVQFVIGILLAEFLYPGYSASLNYISDLGVQQPSSFIFNASVTILSILVLICSYFIRREFNSSFVPILFGLSGAGAIGVGLFPETAGIIHEIVSFMAFLFGGLSAIAASKLVKAPFTYISVLMGITSLAALILFMSEIYLGLGPGGMERLIVYPVLLWIIGFGGNLMSPQQA